ncbi:MAG: hypothetical protein K8R77_08705 [Anaerolineaceae bacterium]|nr:hypothetical protein [Anaerolineaceae bacterium]
MIKKNLSSKQLITNSILTLLLAGLMWGVYRDMDAWFRPQLVHATRISFTALAAILVELLVAAGVLVAVWRPNWLAPMNRLRYRFGRFRWGLLFLFAVGGGLFFLIDKSQVFNGPYARFSLIVLFLGIAGWLATEEEDRNWSWRGLFTGGLVFVLIFLYAVRLQKVTNHPFSLFWSEGNRLWDYSIPFGRRLYNYPAGEEIYSLTGISRRTLWGIPYLLPGVQIWMLRFWDVLVFTVPHALLGWAVFHEERKKNKGLFLLLGGWSMLFLNQGPIYSPLVLAAILVVLVRKSPFWLNVLAVVAASYYASISRYTWMFAPGMWAAMLAFLDQDWDETQNWIQNWLQSILLGVAGFLGGYVLKELVKQWTGANFTHSGVLSVEGIQQTISRQPLLWDRLLPNSTYAPGILLALLIAVAPLVILILHLIVSKRWKLHFWQKLAAAAFMTAFLGVGLVVSVKIGGGSNLHNLDMFLIGLLLMAGLAWQKGGRELLLKMEANPTWLQVVLLGLVLIPATAVIREANHAKLPPSDLVAEALVETQTAVAEARQEGEVLFLDQRQLLTFGYVGDVPLVVEYEKKQAMNEAMAENADYFEPYYADLADRRFSLIVSEPLQVKFQGDVYNFGSENDAWVKWVSIPMLCYYEPLVTYPEVGLELLVPRAETESPVEDVACPFP